MYTAILRRAISTYTIILRRVNRMKIFVFVYIRRWGGLVAQGIRGIHRSCFCTQNRNDNRNGNRNSAGSRGVYCTCLGTRNRNGVRSYCTCLSTQNRNGTAGRIWREIVKDSRNFSNLPAGITPFVSKLLKLPWREPSGFRNVTVFTISKKISPKKCFWQEIEKICRIL